MKIEKITTAILILILMLGLLNGLMSCSTSKVSRMVYVPENTYDTTARQGSDRIFTLTKN